MAEHRSGEVQPVGGSVAKDRSVDEAVLGASESGLADFTQSTGACAPAIARDASIEISFDENVEQAEGTVLPAIQNDASVLERMQTRGRSDAIALHKQYHDARTHARFQPATDTSQRLHAMAEQVRVEVLGSEHFAGIGRNLDAALDARYQSLLDAMQSPVVQSLTDGQVKQPLMGIDHALSLYLREQLTGRSLPPAANQVLSEWREWLDSDVSEKFKPDDFDVHDQQGFAEALKHLLRSLELDSGDENDAPDGTNSATTLKRQRIQIHRRMMINSAIQTARPCRMMERPRRRKIKANPRTVAMRSNLKKIFLNGAPNSQAVSGGRRWEKGCESN